MIFCVCWPSLRPISPPCEFQGSRLVRLLLSLCERSSCYTCYIYWYGTWVRLKRILISWVLSFPIRPDVFETWYAPSKNLNLFARPSPRPSPSPPSSENAGFSWECSRWSTLSSEHLLITTLFATQKWCLFSGSSFATSRFWPAWGRIFEHAIVPER
jgi:hypothetical protein